MNNDSISQQVTQQYIDAYLESSRKIAYTQLREQDGLERVFYDELPRCVMRGYPAASDYVGEDGQVYDMASFAGLSDDVKRKCRLRYYYLPTCHELYVGTTGSGKTTGCVEPQLRAISAQSNKPNLFVTDPKGELFDRNVQHLRENGYKVFILNFKDLGRSDHWNPLLEIYNEYQAAVKVGKDKETCSGTPVGNDCGYELCDPIERYDGECYYVYDNKAYAFVSERDSDIVFERENRMSHVDVLVNQFVNVLIQVRSQKDPTWEFGAQDLLRGLVYCLLENSVKDPAFKPEMMTIKTLHDYYMRLRNDILGDNKILYTHPLVSNISQSTLAYMNCALNNAPNTMRSYCGVFDNSTCDWFQGHIYSLTTGHTVDIMDLDCPFAVFLVTRDYEKSDFQVAGLFVDWVYRTMLQQAERNPQTRAMHFLLDEFGNIPPIKDFETKIATSRSRNIWFHLVVQSYLQMDAVYGETQAGVIRDNCNAQIFLGSQNYKTKEAFSMECGKHCVPTLAARFNPSVHDLTLVPLVPVSDLEQMPVGTMYVKRLYGPVIVSQFIRSYIAAQNGTYAHFFGADGLCRFAPHNDIPYTAPCNTYQRIFDKDAKVESSDNADWDII